MKDPRTIKPLSMRQHTKWSLAIAHIWFFIYLLLFLWVGGVFVYEQHGTFMHTLYSLLFFIFLGGLVFELLTGFFFLKLFNFSRLLIDRLGLVLGYSRPHKWAFVWRAEQSEDSLYFAECLGSRSVNIFLWSDFYIYQKLKKSGKNAVAFLGKNNE